MAHTNHTTNYELSQFLGSDKPSWLNDYNGDMAKIDTAVKNAADAASTAASTASGLSGTVNTLTNTTIPGIQGDISDLQAADVTIENTANTALVDAGEAKYFTFNRGTVEDPYYRPVTMQFWAAHGFVTASAKEVNLFLDLPRMFNPDQAPLNIDLNTLNIMLKGVTGNLYGSTYRDLLNDPDVSVDVQKAGTNQLRIKLTFSNALDSNANQCPCEAYGTIQVEIT